MADTRDGPPAINPARAVVGALHADGTVMIVDCAECPYRQILCYQCVVPQIRAEMDADGILEITD
jgi:hypothetical protein